MLSIIALFVAQPAVHSSGDEDRRAELIEKVEQTGARKRLLFDCIYAADPQATIRMLKRTGPYSFLAEDNRAFDEFSQGLLANETLARCTFEATQKDLEGNSNPPEEVTFTLRERDYRSWAVRRFYLEQVPSFAAVKKLTRVKRSKGDYGANTGPINGLLKTIDCTVKKRPEQADWIVRNSVPFSRNIDVRKSPESKRLYEAFYDCSGFHTPNNGPDELANNTTGLLADSLLRAMPNTVLASKGN